LLLLSAVGVSAALAPAAAAAGDAPSIAASPAAGTVGTLVTLTGSGFPKRTAVALTWVDSSAGLPAVTTSAAGSLRVSFHIPLSDPGAYAVHAAVGGIVASTPVEVLAGGVLPPPSAPPPLTATTPPIATRTPAPPGAATGTPPAVVTSSPPSIRIDGPLSNQAYSGEIAVRAVAANVQAVSYQVDLQPLAAMAYSATGGVWLAALDTATLVNGLHNVSVIAEGLDGSTVQDRAWSVSISNAAATPLAPVTATPSATPLAPVPPGGAKPFGVNLAAAEFGPQHLPGTAGVDYTYPAGAGRAAYFAGKGLTLIRLPFLWERVQPAAYGHLSAADVGGIRALLDDAQASGAQVILDLHNYGRYYGAPLTRADAGKLADVWGKLAQAFRGHPGLYGYELMNEPHDLPEGPDSWAYLAQAAADGIRRYDSQAWLLVPGYSWQSARFWADNNASLDVRDPAGRLLYAAHLYFDADHTGTYRNSYDADRAYSTIGVDRLQPYLAWLAARNARGILTEYGVPDNDARWSAALDLFLAALASSPRIQGGTYWAAGPWWGTFALSVEPRSGQDRPQMAVLARYPSR
jgi:endoglucanase